MMQHLFDNLLYMITLTWYNPMNATSEQAILAGLIMFSYLYIVAMIGAACIFVKRFRDKRQKSASGGLPSMNGRAGGWLIALVVCFVGVTGVSAATDITILEIEPESVEWAQDGMSDWVPLTDTPPLHWVGAGVPAIGDVYIRIGRDDDNVITLPGIDRSAQWDVTLDLDVYPTSASYTQSSDVDGGGSGVVSPGPSPFPAVPEPTTVAMVAALIPVMLSRPLCSNRHY